MKLMKFKYFGPLTCMGHCEYQVSQNFACGSVRHDIVRKDLHVNILGVLSGKIGVHIKESIHGSTENMSVSDTGTR